MLSLLVAAAAAGCVTAAAPWRKADPVPPPPSLSSSPLGGPHRPLNIHLWSIPAHGHYMTLRDVGVALAARGHNVSFVLCERNRDVFEKDGMPAAGLRFLSAGACPIYDDYDRVMAAMLRNENMETVGAMLDGVSTLAHQMCAAVLPLYERAAAQRRRRPSGATSSSGDLDAVIAPLLPDVIVFDADTFCAIDASVRYRIPRVARLGTSVRDAYTNPSYVPQYQSALPVRMDARTRVINSLLLTLSRRVISPALLPNLVARNRAHWLNATVQPATDEQVAAALGLPAPPPPAAIGSNASVAVAADGTLSNGSGGGGGIDARATSFDAAVPDAGPLDATAARVFSASRELDASPDAFRADIPWDGIPTLINSHWGLEHARPLQPYEHMVGHTTAFQHEAATPLPPAVDAWLAAAPDVPVVYVALGTMAIVEDSLLKALAAAFTGSARYRFLWSVKASQQGLLEEGLRLAAAEWFAAHAALVAAAASSNSNEDTTAAAGGSAVLPPVGPGSVLLVDWAPQLAVLTHNTTAVFITHGGMNGVAEGTYAHTPMLCLPLFSDQPDNCQHMQDYGFAIRMNRDAVTPAFVAAALDALTGAEAARPGDGSGVGAAPHNRQQPLPHPVGHDYHAAIHTAWVRNVAAGGIPRAVQIIEAQADAPYGDFRNTVPRAYFLPWWQRAELDLWGFWGALLALVVGIAWGCGRVCCCVSRRACSRCRAPRATTGVATTGVQ